MKISNAKVTLSFDNPNELIEAMDEDEKLDFFQSLSCHEPIIKYVMQQVFDSCTDNGYHGSMVCSWDGDSAIQQFQKRMIDTGADYMSRRKISELNRYCESMTKEILELKEEISRLTGEY